MTKAMIIVIMEELIIITIMTVTKLAYRRNSIEKKIYIYITHMYTKDMYIHIHIYIHTYIYIYIIYIQIQISQ